MAQAFKKLEIDVVPGQKLCAKCRVQFYKSQKKQIETTSSESDIEAQSVAREDEVREDLDSSLDDYGVSPVKLHGIASHSRVTYGKRKFQQVKEKLQEQQSSVQEKLSKIIKVTPEKLESPPEEQPESLEELKQKAKDLDTLVALMKEKMRNLDRKKKIQILTLAPSSWSVAKVSRTFNVTQYVVRQARKLGFMELPEQRSGRPLAKEIQDLVIKFYSDDEYSRQMPGKKDFVSVKRNVHVQKRLLLCSLKELYAAFEQNHPNVKIGFSKFCSLRPKWCVLVGSSGTHSVCVCTIHQNVELMVSALKSDTDTHKLVEMMVCDRDNKECMIHRCKDCPNVDEIRQYLQSHLQENEEDCEDGDAGPEDEFIEFKQWTTTDRAELLTIKMSVGEFIESLIGKLDQLTKHSFIAKAQSRYLKKCKEDLKNDEAIVLLDFAENYKFVIQDEVQSYHWNQQSCSLHPVVIYYKQNDNLTDDSVCFISDDLNHDVDFVHEVMNGTVKHIMENISDKI
ncbi:uncharacterized protein [Apostichopus japonicus]|uniref:uncharacterized protein n=1 Tax=Stichopus japonicus TaxID=307972 RepID=UPI003AB7506A